MIRKSDIPTIADPPDLFLTLLDLTVVPQLTRCLVIERLEACGTEEATLLLERLQDVWLAIDILRESLGVRAVDLVLCELKYERYSPYFAGLPACTVASC